MRALNLAGLLLLVMVTRTASAEERMLRLYGYAYDLKSNAYLYTEVHEQKIVDGKWISGSIIYLAPDGSEMGHKALDFSYNESVPVYQLTLHYNGYNEAITAVGKTVEMARQDERGAKIQTKSVELSANMAADSGFHIYLRERFAELMQGKAVDFKFVVAGSLDTFKFRARKVGDTQFEGKPAVRILVEANSLLSLVAPELNVTYEPIARKLVEYRGPSNIHNPRTGDPYDVRIAYYSTPPADAPKLPPLK